jgi:glycosyltransferase involved in cell wall biosynthesis
VGEAFGSVYLEAMAAGLPVVACRGDGPEGFINADRARPVGWLVPPDDELALAEALVEALSHPLIRQARGAAALALVRKRFSWTNVSTAVSQVYSAVTK